MKRDLTLAMSALAVLLASTAFADVEEITDIDVTLDLSAIQNEAAAAYWSNLELDLETAIAARTTELLADESDIQPVTTSEVNEADAAPEGTRVLIEIRELELATAFERAMNAGDTVLVGQVNIVDLTDNSNAAGYELSVSLEGAGVVLTEGNTFTLKSDDTATYQLLVDAFADGVVTRLN